MTSLYHLLHVHPVRPEVGERVPLEVEEEEDDEAEEAIIIWLVTQMSNYFCHFPMEITHLRVEVHLIAATTAEERVALDNPRQGDLEVLSYSVVR